MEDQKDAASFTDDPDPTSSNEAETSSPKQPPPASPTSPSENLADMAPGGKRPNTPKRDVDLSTLLTPAEKTELVSFVAKVTDNMQNQIIQVFDSTGVDDNAGLSRLSFWGKLPAHLRDLTLSAPQVKTAARPVANKKENMKPSGPQTAEIVSPVIGLDEVDQPEGPRLQELKKEVLLHFKKWQAAVQKRVGDITVKRTTEPQGGQSSSGGFRKGFSNNRNKQRESKTLVVEADPTLLRLYPPTSTSMCSMPPEKKALILHSMLLLLLSLEHYSAYSRVLLLNIASSLHLPLRILAEDEVRVAKSLSEIAKDISADEVILKKAEETRSSRKWKVAIAGAAGAALLGVTGGLAAPLVAAGIGSILGGVGLGTTAAAGLLGTMAESSFLVGSLFGIFGARATGKMMDQYVKDIQDFAFIPLHGSIGEDSEIGKVKPENRRLRVIMGVSGWLSDEADVFNPWRALGEQNEVYAVRFEMEPLLKLGNALETVVKSAAWSMAKKEIIARTSERRSKPPIRAPKANKYGPVFASLFEALWPIGLLKISKIIDNPWSVGMVRGDKTGAVLADVIINKAQGERGVTLIGFSLGARVIYSCLMVLAERRAFGLVENVVLMGTPAPADAEVWCTLKSVVSGRLVNVYSENDYILGFLYRTSSIQFGVAGLQKIEGIDGVENVDVSAKVSGHLRYQFLVGSILKHIGWEDVDLDEVAANEAALAMVEEKFREREKKRNAIEPDVEAKQLEAEVQEKNVQGAIRTRMRKMKNKK